jgi:hypothetical protein
MSLSIPAIHYWYKCGKRKRLLDDNLLLSSSPFELQLADFSSLRFAKEILLLLLLGGQKNGNT